MVQSDTRLASEPPQVREAADQLKPRTPLFEDGAVARVERQCFQSLELTEHQQRGYVHKRAILQMKSREGVMDERPVHRWQTLCVRKCAAPNTDFSEKRRNRALERDMGLIRCNVALLECGNAAEHRRHGHFQILGTIHPDCQLAELEGIASRKDRLDGTTVDMGDDGQRFQASEPPQSVRRRVGKGRAMERTDQLHFLQFGMALEERHDGIWTAVHLAPQGAEGRFLVICESAHDQTCRFFHFILGQDWWAWSISRIKVEAPKAGEEAKHFRNPGGDQNLGGVLQAHFDVVHMHVPGRVPDEGLDARLKGSGIVVAATTSSAEGPVLLVRSFSIRQSFSCSRVRMSMIARSSSHTRNPKLSRKGKGRRRGEERRIETSRIHDHHATRSSGNERQNNALPPNSK